MLRILMEDDFEDEDEQECEYEEEDLGTLFCDQYLPFRSFEGRCEHEFLIGTITHQKPIGKTIRACLGTVI